MTTSMLTHINASPRALHTVLERMLLGLATDINTDVLNTEIPTLWLFQWHCLGIINPRHRAQHLLALLQGEALQEGAAPQQR
jgi:hypothetical protein